MQKHKRDKRTARSKDSDLQNCKWLEPIKNIFAQLFYSVALQNSKIGKDGWIMAKQNNFTSHSTAQYN